MRVSVYIATSLDGFIAREDGGLDWLPDGGANADADDYGY
jgi:dihydrofolate reductase